MEKHALKIDGMHCASCAVRVEGALRKIPGVKQASVNYALGEAFVEGEQVDATALQKAVQKEGYKVRMPEMHHEHDHGGVKAAKRKAFLSALFALPVFVIGMFGITLPAEIAGISTSHAVALLLTTVVVFVFGREFHASAAKQAVRLNADMDTLISVGTLAAYLFSLWSLFRGGAVYFDTAATITSLILIGRYFEALSKGRAGDAIQKLLELGVKQAHLLTEDGSTRDVAIEALQVGDMVLVKPGEKFPLDAMVEEGDSLADESMLTGESVPVKKSVGSSVFGVTVNQGGALKVRITADYGNSTLAQIVDLVKNAQAQKAPIQKLADRISGIFVPVVILVAMVTLVLWWIASGSFAGALIPAVAVLVIACPCALGLATPTAILVGTGRAAQQGIFIKSGEALEHGRSINMIMLDKTGTITIGRPEVTDLLSVKKDADWIRLAASVEAASEHPLASAIVRAAKERSLSFASAENVQAEAGHGVAGVVEGKQIRIGKRDFAHANGLSEEIEMAIAGFEAMAKTIVYVSVDGAPSGVLAIADPVKPDAKEAVAMLKRMGLEVMMITGDHKKTAQAIADQVGIVSFASDVLPQDKLRLVKEKQEKGMRVAFVGDGINDAPALTQSDLGIAVGEGTDIAIEAGEVVLMGGEAMKIPQAIAMSRRTVAIIRQNLFWAFFYNIIGIPVAAFGLLNPMIAAGAMAFSSVSVLVNSLRLRK